MEMADQQHPVDGHLYHRSENASLSVTAVVDTMDTDVYRKNSRSAAGSVGGGGGSTHRGNGFSSSSLSSSAFGSASVSDNSGKNDSLSKLFKKVFEGKMLWTDYLNMIKKSSGLELLFTTVRDRLFSSSPSPFLSFSPSPDRSSANLDEAEEPEYKYGAEYDDYHAHFFSGSSIPSVDLIEDFLIAEKKNGGGRVAEYTFGYCGLGTQVSSNTSTLVGNTGVRLMCVCVCACTYVFCVNAVVVSVCAFVVCTCLMCCCVRKGVSDCLYI
jgi:hypothetical protein